MMNDDFHSSFVVQLPHCYQRHGTCERAMKGRWAHLYSLSPPVSVGVVALRSPCWWAWCLAMGGEGSEWWVTCLDVLVVMRKVVGRGFGQNSHSRNLPVSLLGR